jgi:hypothetical protein
MKAADYLSEAKAIIGDRQEEYGHPTDTMQRTARLWEAYLEMPIAPHQVAVCMAMVKIARSMDSKKADNWIDAAGYVAIAAQTQEGDDLYV